MDKEIITKQMMEQYELVRSIGAVNMIDYSGVVNQATSLRYYALGSLTMDEYRYLLENYDRLLEKYFRKRNKGGGNGQ